MKISLASGQDFSFPERCEYEMKTVFQGKLFTVKQGETADEEAETVERPPSVIIIPFTKDGKVMLIKEYRKEQNKSVIGFITGRANSTDMAKEAMRELAEEGKVKANRLKLFHISTVSEQITWNCYCYVATGLKPANALQDADEIIEPFECTLDEAYEYVLSDNFSNDKPGYLLLKLRHDLQTGKFKLP